MPDRARDEGVRQSFQPREFLRRELSEIFLLIQHITSQPGKQLSNVFTQEAAAKGLTLDAVWRTYEAVASDPQPAADGEPGGSGMAPPPPWPGASPALLLDVKDRLAMEARPATALTIAFTYLSTSQRLSVFSVFRTAMRTLYKAVTDTLYLLFTPIRAMLKLAPAGPPPPPPVDPGVLFAGLAFPALPPKKNDLWTAVSLSLIVLFALIVWSASASWTLTAGVRAIDDYASLVKLRQANEDAIAAEGRDLEKAISEALLPLAQDNAEVTRTAKQIAVASQALDSLVASADHEQAARRHDEEDARATAAQLALTRAAKHSKGVKVQRAVALTPPTPPVAPVGASDKALELIDKIASDIRADAPLVQNAASLIATASAPHRTVYVCDFPKLLGHVGTEASVPIYASLKQRSLCDEGTALKDKIEAARLVIARWVWSQDNRLPYKFGFDVLPVDADTINIEQALAYANMLIQRLNFNILPASLAGLASLVAGLRWLNAQIENNELSPRNLQMFWPRIFLGVSLGVAIGMLSSPTNDGKGVTLPGLSSEGVVVSAPLLAFLAGFATNRIFSWLDDLVSHIFSFGRKPDERNGAAPRPAEG